MTNDNNCRLSFFNVAERILNNLVEFDSTQQLIKTKYLLALKYNELEKKKLDRFSYSLAEINSFVERELFVVISTNLDDKDFICKIMDGEYKRIIATSKNYSDSTIDLLSYEEIRSIIKRYFMTDELIDRITNDICLRIIWILRDFGPKKDIKENSKVISLSEYRKNKK